MQMQIWTRRRGMWNVWNDAIQYSPEAVRYLCTCCLLHAFDDA